MTRAVRSRLVSSVPSQLLASGGDGGVHRLQLGVVVVEPLQRPDGEQLAVAASAAERDRRVHETVDVEGVVEDKLDDRRVAVVLTATVDGNKVLMAARAVVRLA